MGYRQGYIQVFKCLKSGSVSFYFLIHLPLPGLIPRWFPSAARWFMIPRKEPVSFPGALTEALGRGVIGLAWVSCPSVSQSLWPEVMEYSEWPGLGHVTIPRAWE